MEDFLWYIIILWNKYNANAEVDIYSDVFVIFQTAFSKNEYSQKFPKKHTLWFQELKIVDKNYFWKIMNRYIF